MPVIINTLQTSAKSFVDFGDIIIYTFTIRNVGNIPISNVYLVDTLPSSVSFTSNSVFINSIQSTGFNPSIAMTLPNLLANEAVTVSFECGVDSTFPLPTIISNLGNLLYSYTLTSSNFRQSDLSNQSNINLNKALLSVTKSTSDFSGINYPLPTTIVINNFGNTLATDLVLREMLDLGTTIDLNSIKEDGISISGDPVIGISLSNLTAGSVKTVFYNLLVNSLPSSSFIETYNNISYAYKIDPSSTVKSTTLTGSYYELATISSAILSTTYTVNPPSTLVGMTVTYSLSIQNVGNTLGQYINMLDSLPSSISFVPGSVIINGTNFPAYNPNLSISIPDLVPNNITTVSFLAIVNTIPSLNPIENNALIDYKSELPSTSSLNSLSNVTNTTSLNVISDIISFTKSSDKFFYTLGDTITYTLSIFNQGTINLFNCILYDSLPSSLLFINNSVQINGFVTSDNPNLGISLYTIPYASTVTIIFSAKVVN